MRAPLGRLACVALAIGFASCLDPTEIVVVVSTDVACTDVAAHGVAIAIGEPNDDTTSASAATHDCSSDGGIGSLTVLPRGISDAVGIRVMLGVDASVEDCDVAHGFAGCVVARRSLRFDPHHPLTLPIELQGSCVGQVCSPDSTCFNGSCVDASVECDGASCGLPDASPPPPPPPPTCVPIAEKVVESVAVAYTPRIAKIPKGWVITWVAPSANSNALFMTTLDDNGSPASPIQIQKLTGTVASLGPIGSDGQTFVTFLDDTTAISPLVIVSGSLGATVSLHSTAGLSPLDGVLPTTTSIYESIFVYGTTAGLYDVTQTTVLPGAQFTNLDLTASTDFGLARAGGTAFVANVQAQQCHIHACAGGACSSVFNQTCSHVRIAAAAPATWAAVMTTSQETILAWSNGTLSSVPLGTRPAQAQAILPLITSGGLFGFTLDGSESLVRYTMPPTTPTLVAASLGFGTKSGGTGAGFDGVADDPASSTGQGLVYFRSDGTTGGTVPGTGSIWFTHLCQ